MGCCPVNCTFVETPNASCSATCGGGKRSKFTIIEQSACNGTACPENQWEDCNTEPCHCESEWQDWSACSEDCGPGIRTRTPNITGYPTDGGRNCPEKEEEKCNEEDCKSVAGLIAGGK